MPIAICRRLFATCLLAACCAVPARADDAVPDTRGEQIRQGILDYLGDIRAKKGELNAVEARVKEVLGTDARIKDLKGAKIERDGNKFTVDVWTVDAKTGTFSIILTNPTRTSTLIFEGSATPRADGSYRVSTQRVLHAHGK